MSQLSKSRLSRDIIFIGFTNCVCQDKTRVKGHVDILLCFKERKDAKSVSVNFTVLVRALCRNILPPLLRLYLMWVSEDFMNIGGDHLAGVTRRKSLWFRFTQAGHGLRDASTFKFI